MPAERQVEYQEAQYEILTTVSRIVTRAPKPFADRIRREARLCGIYGPPGALVLTLMLRRMPDLLSNTLSKRYLRIEEMEAYLRNNVRSRWDEPLEPLHLLALIAYEYQYLLLSDLDDPMRCLFEKTFIKPFLFNLKVIRRGEFCAFLEATARMCACYEVDESAFRILTP